MNKKAPTLFATFAVFAAGPLHAQDASDAAKDAPATAAEVVETIEAAVDVPMTVVEDIQPVYPQPPRLRSWRMVRPIDYPVEAWREDQEGIVDYSVEVDAEGKPKSCAVTKSSGSEPLDAAICPIVMERGEFRPAMSGPDEPITGTYQGYHNWRKREPDLPQMSITFRYLHGADGVSTECEFLRMENIPERMRKDIDRDIERGTLCKGSGLGSSRGIPYRDESGEPVAKRVTVTFDVQLEDPVEPVE